VLKNLSCRRRAVSAVQGCAAGGLILNSRKITHKIVNDFENPTCPERCIGSLYEKYINLM
jgi:hypothetical protein